MDPSSEAVGFGVDTGKGKNDRTVVFELLEEQSVVVSERALRMDADG